MNTPHILRLTICAPGDVSKEVALAKAVIDEWNNVHGEGLNCWIKHQYWLSDAYPDMLERPQEVVNRQIIDDADILVAILWSRFGTPTGVANSGTEEEIRRGIQKGKRVLIYFSRLEPLPPTAEQKQLEQLAEFKAEMLEKGLCWTFTSRRSFESDFAKHLAKTVHELRAATIPPKKTAPKKRSIKIKQEIHGGTGHTVIGVQKNYSKEPAVKNVLTRREGSITPREEREIHEIINSLVDLTPNTTQEEARGMWWSRLKNKFEVIKYESLMSVDMPSVRAWKKQQAAILKRGLKKRDPDQWTKLRKQAIHAAMKAMGRSDEEYYPELARRLGMKKPFTSLTQLTKTDLQRVYNRVMDDQNQR